MSQEQLIIQTRL